MSAQSERSGALSARIAAAGLSLLAMGLVVGWGVRAAPLGEGEAAGSMEALLFSGLLRAAMGVLAFLLAVRIPARRLRAAAPWILALALGLLALTLVPGIGQKVGGARRWIRFAGVGFQPSEFAKLALIVFLADRLSHLDAGRGLASLVPAMGGVIAMAGMVLLEPDVGTTAFLLATAGAMVILAGAPLRVFAVVAAAAGMLGAGVLLLRPDVYAYLGRRIASVMEEPSYQIRESLVAIGSGGWLGVGLGASHQKLGFLPEGSRDFIFSILGEETGLVGTMGVVGLFAVLVVSGVQAARGVADPFLALVAYGVAFSIGLQALIHMGVATGLLPPKGIPLPFLSTGGSSLAVSLAQLGLLARTAQANLGGMHPGVEAALA